MPATPPGSDDRRPSLARCVAGRLGGAVSLLVHRVAPRHHRVTNPATPELRAVVRRHADDIARTLGDPRLGRMFERQMLDTWQTTLTPRPDGRVMVITGDIPAMWLRDSSAQLRPFLLLARESDAVRAAIAGVVAQQWDLVAIDPHANAFTRDGSSRTWNLFDLPTLPGVWERKYEIDSLAFPVQLAWQLWRVTGSSDHLTAAVHDGFATVVDVWTREQRHRSASAYRFVRPGSGDTLPDDGRGAPVAECGLTWSGFRPSDDACRYGYNIPAQLMAAHALSLVAELAASVFADADLAARATELAAHLTDGVHDVGTTSVDAGGEARAIWAYEVDGLGGVLVGDDANMPSLLSLPLVAGIAADDPMYLSTREAVLSPDNPWWFRGSAASGIGSPHTPGRRVWPIALAVQALTSRDRDEQLALVGTLAATDAGTGLMHESFAADNPEDFTRPWFSWANSMFCELLLTLTSGSLADAVGVPGAPAPDPR